MIGTFILLLMAGATLLLMRVAGLRGAMLTFAGAALLIGGAGYALQGRPDLQGSPRAGAPAAAPIPLAAVREQFFGRFFPTEHWLIIADSLEARGKTEQAAKILQAGLNEHPRDHVLWTGLGNVLANHGRGLNPAAKFAFARAKALAPQAPAPDYFLGLAQLRSGEVEQARQTWSALLARARPNAPWRETVESGIRLADTIAAQPDR